jgi:hypothetical protein
MMENHQQNNPSSLAAGIGCPPQQIPHRQVLASKNESMSTPKTMGPRTLDLNL